MAAKRGRPPSQKTIDSRREKDVFKKTMGDIPDFINNEPFPNQLTQGLIDGRKTFHNSQGRTLPLELIEATCMDEIDPPVWIEYQQRLKELEAGQKEGGKKIQQKAAELAKQLCGKDDNKILIDRISSEDLTVHEVAVWIHEEWPTRGIGGNNKSVKQIERYIKSYLKNNSK